MTTQQTAGVTSRRIAVVTTVLLAASVLGFTVVLRTSVGSTPWVLPTYLAVVAVVGITGSVLAWRARHR